MPIENDDQDSCMQEEQAGGHTAQEKRKRRYCAGPVTRYGTGSRTRQMKELRGCKASQRITVPAAHSRFDVQPVRRAIQEKSVLFAQVFGVYWWISGTCRDLNVSGNVPDLGTRFTSTNRKRSLLHDRSTETGTVTTDHVHKSPIFLQNPIRVRSKHPPHPVLPEVRLLLPVFLDCR